MIIAALAAFGYLNPIVAAIMHNLGSLLVVFNSAHADSVTWAAKTPEIEADGSFTRPIYAGNAIATVKSSDAKKVLTERCSRR